jgi:hypothetical protein
MTARRSGRPNKKTGTDDGTDAKRHQGACSKGSLESLFGVGDLRHQLIKGFSDKQTHRLDYG